MLDIVNPLAHTRGEKALSTPVDLVHHSVVLLHSNEEGSGRAKGKEMVNL